MNFKGRIMLVLILAFTSACGESATESITGSEIDFNSLTQSLSRTKHHQKSLKNFGLADNVIPTKREELGNMQTIVKLYNGNQNAGLTIPGFGGIKLGRDETNLNVYYIETKVVKTNNQESIVYGIGYSVHYLFKKVKRKLDVSNLPSIAASVQIESNKTQVFYSLQTYGVNGVSLVKYFKPNINKNFDVDGFGLIQSSIDGIHNILGDTVFSKTITFTPSVLKFIKPEDLN